MHVVRGQLLGKILALGKFIVCNIILFPRPSLYTHRVHKLTFKPDRNSQDVQSPATERVENLTHRIQKDSLTVRATAFSTFICLPLICLPAIIVWVMFKLLQILHHDHLTAC